MQNTIEQFIIEAYKEGKPERQVAEELGLSLKKVHTTLKKAGCLRSKSEAQSLALKTGRSKNPKKKESN